MMSYFITSVVLYQLQCQRLKASRSGSSLNAADRAEAHTTQAHRTMSPCVTPEMTRTLGYIDNSIPSSQQSADDERDINERYPLMFQLRVYMLPE
jgi:hypothetical protein